MTAIAAPQTIPGPKPMLALGWRGNMLQFFRDPITYMTTLYQRYGEVAAFVQGGNGNVISPVEGCKMTVFGFGAGANQQVLSDTATFYTSKTPASQLNQPAIDRLLAGIFSMNGDKHKQQRRLMMPAFHKKHIEAYRDDMVRLTDDMLNSWMAGETRDISRDMMRLTLRIACKTLFGLETQNQNESIGDIIQQWMGLNLSPAVMMMRVNVPGTPYHRFLSLAEKLEAEFVRVINSKRGGNGESTDVLSMLVHARDENGEQMTEKELVGQANVLFFAGHETTANTLTWTLFLLSQHPDVLANVMDELDGALQGNAPTPAQLQSMPLLERVIKEAMRILPPVPMGVRIVAQDTELGGFPIPQSSELLYSAYVTHHMPQIYTEPEKFDPDRWLRYEPTPYEYVPFGGGARMCIGATFAMMEAKLVLAMMLQRYRLSLPVGAQVDRHVTITMAPKNCLPMNIHAQDRQFKGSSTPIRGNIRESVILP